jgi:hypothetical protein
MKKLTIFSATLALCSVPAFAQSPDTTSRPAQTPDSNSQSNETSRPATTGANKTLTGCLMQRNGKYILMPMNQSSGASSNQYGGQSQSSQSDTQSGQTGSQSSQSGTQSGQTSAQSNQSGGQTSGQSDAQSGRGQGIELMSTQDLKQHVGHTVRVTGVMTGAPAMSNNSGTASNDTANSSDSANSNSQSKSSSSGSQNSGNRGKLSHRTMTVTDVEEMSQSCTSGANAPSSQPH